MYLLFLNAFGLGMACAAPPGAVAAESLRRGVVKGFRAALRVQLGSLVGDGLWACVALFGNGLISHNEILHITLSIVGIVLLLNISYRMLSDAKRGMPLPANGNTQTGAFRSGMILSIANPYAIAFWIGVGGALAALGADGESVYRSSIFFGGFMLASVICAFGMAILIAYGRSYLSQKYYRAVNIACGLFLVYLCVNMVRGILHQ